MKVAHVCTSGYSHKILESKLELLQKRGHEVHLVSSAEGADATRFKDSDIKLHFVPMNREISLIDDIKSIGQLKELFQRERFDVVHTHTSKAGVLGRIAARLAGIQRVVHTSHGLPFYRGQNVVKYNVYKSLEMISGWFSDVVASQNMNDLSVLSKFINKKKLVYEGNGVDLDFIERIALETTDAMIQEMKTEWNIPSDSIILLVGARFEPVKDHLLLIQALEQLIGTNRDFCCVLAGQGELESILRQEVMNRGLRDHVKFVGYQRNIYAWILMSDIVMLTSEKEGIPRIIMESMALKKPVVATKVQGTEELVVDKETGLLSPYRDVEKLCENIRILLNDAELRRVYGDAGRRRVELEFTEQLVIDRMIRMYQPEVKNAL